MQQTSHKKTYPQFLLQRSWLGVVLGLVFCGVTMLVLWIVKPHEYSSEVQMLVVQKYTLTDSYTAAKSAEKISQNLAEVIRTSSFLDQVIATQKVDLTEFEGLDEADKREKWTKQVETDIIPNAAMFTITVYDQSPTIAQAIVEAISDVLVEQGGEYHGAPDTVSLKVVNTALTSDSVVRPKLLVNGVAAGMIGAIIGVLIMFFRPSTPLPIHKLHAVPSPPKKKKARKKKARGSLARELELDEVRPDAPEKKSSPKKNADYRVLQAENFTDHLEGSHQESGMDEVNQDRTVRHLFDHYKK